jgi:exosortase/archaeosortase family protein
MAQAFLVGAYALLILAIFLKLSTLILLSLSLVLTSFLIWLFGSKRSRLIFSVMGAFTFFSGFALVLPMLDWPLRNVAGQCATFGLNALGNQASLGLLESNDPMLILFSSGKPFHVAAECNGFGIITSALLMAAILILYFKSKWHLKLIGLLSALFIGLFFNSLRIVVIVLIAPRIPDNQYLLMHEIVGLITTYGGLGILYFFLSSILSSKSKKTPKAEALAG